MAFLHLLFLLTGSKCSYDTWLTIKNQEQNYIIDEAEVFLP